MSEFRDEAPNYCDFCIDAFAFNGNQRGKDLIEGEKYWEGSFVDLSAFMVITEECTIGAGLIASEGKIEGFFFDAPINFCPKCGRRLRKQKQEGQAMMNREEREQIMTAVCDVCHWPYVYRDEQIMKDEKCDHCPVEAVLNKGGDVNE